MSWKEEADEITRRRAVAEEMGGKERVTKHRERGYLTIRDRIAGTIDPGSFQEVGMLSGTGTYDDEGNLINVKPAPYVMGLGRIDGRLVAIGGEDSTIGGGTNWGDIRRKGGQGGFVDDMAEQYRLPLVRFIDGFGGSAATGKKKGYTVLPGHAVHPRDNSAILLGSVPVVSAVMGVAAGAPAGKALMSHFSIMIKGQSQIFAGGPPLVERGTGETVTREELGGWKIAVEKAGVIHNVAKDEEDCFRQIKQFLSYMPQNVWEMPPIVRTDDPVDRREEELLDIVPRDRRKPYDMHKLIRLVMDKDSTFEIQPRYGRAAITTLSRLNGYPVGIIANNPMYGGVVDVKSARKQAHFIDLCDCFHIPLLFLIDVPGYAIGTVAEEDGTLLEGMRQLHARLQSTVPQMSLVIRRCFGMAGGTALDKNGLDLKIAWPSAEWGSLPIEGGVTAAFRREIAEAPNPEARRKELEEEMRSYANPFKTAEAFSVEDIIDPRETRQYLCTFYETMQARLKEQIGQKAKFGVRP
ncbi:MAG: acyl-CoA carboxylase subunit beta [Alphaproteobacteria bacterium]